MSSRRSIKDQVIERAAAGATETVDLLARRPSKAKRDRSWERKQQGKVTFRGIPKELNDELNAIARRLGVTVSDVGRTLIEYGLEAYEQGELELHPVLITGKFSLFPGGVSSRRRRSHGDK